MTEQDWENARPTIDLWEKRSRTASNAHRIALKRSANRHYYLGLLLVVLSTLLASSLLVKLTTFFPTHPNWVEFAKLALGFSVALLSGFQAFDGADQKSQKHDSLRGAYSAVCREIEETLALPLSQRGDLSEFLNRIRSRLETLSLTNFHIPEADYEAARLQVDKRDDQKQG